MKILGHHGKGRVVPVSAGRLQEFTDFTDREYFLSPQDIKYVCEKHRQDRL